LTWNSLAIARIFRTVDLILNVRLEYQVLAYTRKNSNRIVRFRLHTTDTDNLTKKQQDNNRAFHCSERLLAIIKFTCCDGVGKR